MFHANLEHVGKVVHERRVGRRRQTPLHVEEVLGHVGRGDGEAVPRPGVRTDALGCYSVRS